MPAHLDSHGLWAYWTCASSLRVCTCLRRVPRPWGLWGVGWVFSVCSCVRDIRHDSACVCPGQAHVACVPGQVCGCEKTGFGRTDAPSRRRRCLSQYVGRCLCAEIIAV